MTEATDDTFEITMEHGVMHNLRFEEFELISSGKFAIEEEVRRLEEV